MQVAVQLNTNECNVTEACQRLLFLAHSKKTDTSDSKLELLNRICSDPGPVLEVGMLLVLFCIA